ncbi:unnamed protein product [Arctia plantaginis]|uniref:Uncharacterized protein n=1 Tax=Arctia plantaginis TaxID=874455 RepID=A0A8S0Z3X6_ARCPL|nr:unnamed protein product [Arctia plantaginis]
MRIVWDDHREGIEHSLAYTMQQTIGKKGLNVFKTKGTVLRLTRSYYQEQGAVGVLFQNLNLIKLPHCWLPDAVLSVASNVLKIETILSKMIINANYVLLRNKSDIIENVVSQDPFKTSPFLFKQVHNLGHVTFLAEGCTLSGYLITRLSGGKINLGHDNLQLQNCEYSVEIYKKKRGDPPVIARFADQNAGNSLDINHYLLMTLREEFVTKIQAALFSNVNTSAVFGGNLQAYEEEQENIFLRTSSNLTKIIRDRNKRILDMNGGSVKIPDYRLERSMEFNRLSSIEFTKMVLTGLDTAYNSYSGGPYKFDDPMVGEQIRFSKLQVRGAVALSPSEGEGDDTYNFAVEITDFAINIEININNGTFNNIKTEVVGYRNIEFMQEDIIMGPLQTLITGYLKNEVPKAIIENMDFHSKPENMKKLTQVIGNKDGVMGSLAMSGTGSETDESNFLKLNE